MIASLYDILFCPFCGNGNVCTKRWAEGVGICTECGAIFAVDEQPDSERKEVEYED